MTLYCSLVRSPGPPIFACNIENMGGPGDEAIDIHTGSEQGGIEFAAAMCVACAREPSA